MPRIHTDSLVARTASELKKKIQSFKPEEIRLPNENDLAADLHVNRATLRQALAILEYEGYILRKQKVGTCLNPYIHDNGVRLEDIYGIYEQIQEFGYTPRVDFSGFEYLPVDSAIARRMDIREGTVMLNSQARFFADDDPAAYVRDYIPVHLIKQPLDTQVPEKSIFNFLDKYCQVKVKYEISQILPVSCDATLGDIMGLPVSTAIIQIDSVVFDQNNFPVMFSELFYNDKYFHFSVVRRFFTPI